MSSSLTALCLHASIDFVFTWKPTLQCFFSSKDIYKINQIHACDNKHFTFEKTNLSPHGRKSDYSPLLAPETENIYFNMLVLYFYSIALFSFSTFHLLVIN